MQISLGKWTYNPTLG